MEIALSVIVCTHNPRADVLEQTLASLRRQQPLDRGCLWELILIDNASAVALQDCVDLSGFAAARIVTEDRLGLTQARLRSFNEARGEILVYVDDDNVLDADYLREMMIAFTSDLTLGAIGGKVVPCYATNPPAWFASLNLSLACRDLGETPLFAAWAKASQAQEYPECAPIGAGLGIRRTAYQRYIDLATGDPSHTALGRQGKNLASGEDNDIIMTALEAGWRVAYLPQLRLVHMIPVSRLEAGYLARYAYSSNLTWVQVLDIHGIRPWQSIPAWTAPLRKARAYVKGRAWASVASHIRWRAACGLIEGRALLDA